MVKKPDRRWPSVNLFKSRFSICAFNLASLSVFFAPVLRILKSEICRRLKHLGAAANAENRRASPTHCTPGHGKSPSPMTKHNESLVLPLPPHARRTLPCAYRLTNPAVTSFSIGAPTRFPHSVQEPS